MGFRGDIIRKALFSLLIVFAAFAPKSAQATHAAGGEIAYKWVSDSTYRIYFKFYRDCSGAPAPANNQVLLCYHNTCNSTSGSFYLTRLTKLPDSTVNGSPVSDGCPGVGTKCTNTSSAVPGYQEWWYTNTVTLPSRCDSWVFSVTIGNRNPSNNLVNAGSRTLYVEATLNNSVAQGNSSPYFSNKPVPSVCINQQYTYNNGGVDPNSDSLTFEMVRPLHNPSSCPPSTSVIAFTGASPSFNLTTNPIQTNNTFTFDTTTGQMSFTPTQVGSSTMSVRINEYRSGVKIGSVVRDIQVQVINCSVPTPVVNTISSTISGATYVNGRVEACAGVTMTFCYDLTSADTAAKLVASDNSSAAAPGASVAYIGQGTDSIRGCLTWKPGTVDTGLRVFTVSASDTTCKSPGVIITQTFVLPIYIWPITDILKDTTLCYGDSTILTAVGGSNFTWTVLSGGSPITTLSCTNCKTPIAKPTMFTQYVVSNSASQYCSKNKDTVDVDVLDIRYDTLQATSNSPICEGGKLLLYSTTAPSGFGYRWSGPNSYNSIQQNPNRSNLVLSDSGYYYLRSTKLHCSSFMDSVFVDITPRPTKPVATNNTPICAGSTINLSVTSDTGVTYTWTGPASFTDTAKNPSITNADTSRAGSYIVTTFKNGCPSEPDTTVAVIYTVPAIDSYYIVRPSNCSDSDAKIVFTGLEASSSYTVYYDKNTVSQAPIAISSNGSGVLTMSNLKAGTYSNIRLNKSGCFSDTIGPAIITDPLAPVLTASSNSPLCVGDTLVFTVNVDSSGATWSWIGPNSFSSSVQNATRPNVTLPDTGAYIVTATKNGCTSEPDTLDVVIYPIPAKPTAGGNTPVCTYDTLQLTSNTVTGATYTWTGPNTYTSALQNPAIYVSDTTFAGDYIITVTVNGCTSEADTASIAVLLGPDNPTASNNTPICEGDTLKLFSTTSTGSTYGWTGPNSFTSSSQNPVIAPSVPAQTGDYILYVYKNGCNSLPDTTTVTVYATPDTPFASNNGPLCTGNTLNLIAQTVMGATYSWTGPNSFTSTIQSPTVSNVTTTEAGVYTVVATINGCPSEPDTTLVVVNVTPAPEVDSVNTVDPTKCGGNDGQIILNGLDASTTYTVNFTKNSTPQSPLSLSTNGLGVLTITGLTEGEYGSITVTAPSGCSSDPLAKVTLTDPTPPSIALFDKSNPTICGGTDGTITLAGLINGYTYSIRFKRDGTYQSPVTVVAGAGGLLTIPNLIAGIYDSITVTIDSCISNAVSAGRLDDPEKPIVAATNNSPVCEDSLLQLFATADSTGVTWSWTGPNSFTSTQQNPVFTNALPIQAGVYSVTASKNNCTSDPDTTTVVVFATPTTPVASNNGPLCDSNTLQLSSTTVTGASYFWSGPKSFTDTVQYPIISPADTSRAGNYIVYVTVNGCESLRDTTEVIIHHKPAIGSYSFTHPTTCSGTEGTITLNGLVADTPYTVSFTKDGT
ncbi:MAG: hypothetical protein KDC11_09605, partial [Chitinophagaceae bacterium]|nr:hypothetical protein [Chitinophagaceae bacterium]